MPCYQCKRPAMYQVQLDDAAVALCLDCYFRFSQIQQQEIENNERMINDLRDQIWSSVGLVPRGPRFPPRPRSVNIGGVKLNNISVTNSVVGAINTGSIGTIDQSISALVQIGEQNLSEAIKALSEAILQSGDLSRNQKNELIECLSVISKEAATPNEVRQNTAALSLLEKAMKVTALANDVADVCQKYWPVLVAAFGKVSGG